MHELTPAETAILGLLAERPMHGYELDSVIDERGLREWAEIGFSSIYFLLRKLEQKRCVRPDGEPAMAKGRKRYAATEHGHAVLRTTCERLISELTPPRAPLLVGLANWPLLEPARATGALRERRRAISREIGRLERQRSTRQPLPAFVDGMFSYAIAIGEAERAWLDATIRQLETDDGKTGSQND